MIASNTALVQHLRIVLPQLDAPAITRGILIVRLVLVLPLILVLPGTAMLRATGISLSGSERVVATVGLGMAMTVCGGLALTPFAALTAFGWVIWLGSVSTVGALVAAVRNRPAARGPDVLRPQIRFRHAALMAVTFCVLPASFALASRNEAAYHPFGYADFWMVRDGSPSSGMFTIGVKNGETTTQDFTVRVLVDHTLVGQWRHLVLAPDQSITFQVTMPAGQQAQAWLYRDGNPPTLYARTSATLRSPGLLASD